MKVLYSIFSWKGKPGGHFFSFDHTITALAEGYVEPVILYIGETHPVVEAIPVKKYHVKPSLVSKKGVLEVVEREKPDVIHCFDRMSFIYMSFFLRNRKVKFLLTKAGGNSDPEYTPYCKDIVLFSQESLAQFKKNHKFDDTALYYIPNRVNRSRLHFEENEPGDTLRMIQVIRINSDKHPAISRTLNFLKILVDKGVQLKLIMAGTVNTLSEKHYIEEFVSSNGLDSYFELITDDRVNRGSDLLSLGDYVIGTGRSVMEAASLGKIVLVPVKNLDYPVLLDSENLDNLLYFNFSGRTDTTYDEKELKKIELSLKDTNYRNDIKSFIREAYLHYFDLSKEIIKQYMKIYKGIEYVDCKKMQRKNLKLWLSSFRSEIIRVGGLTFLFGK